MPTGAANPAIAWLDITQVGLVRGIAASAGLSLIGAGSPDGARTGEVAHGLGCEPIADLRAALALLAKPGEPDESAPRPLVLLASPHGFGADPGGADAQLLAECAPRGVRFATLEPIPASLLELPGAGVETAAAGTGHGPAARTGSMELARFLPLFSASAPARDAAELLADFGPPRVMHFESMSRPGEGSLGARLYDAMNTVLAFFGEPEQVDAAYVPPIALGSGTLRIAPPETLRDLHGRMTANMRYSDGRAVCLLLSDDSPRWTTTLTLLADSGTPDRGGCLRVSDSGLEWTSADGSIVESSRLRDRRKPDNGNTGAGAAAAIAAQIQALLNDRGHATPPVDVTRVLSLTGAALLSARTGEAESPATILRMSKTA